MIPTTIKTDATSHSPNIGPVAPITPVTAASDSLHSNLTLGQKYQAIVDVRLANGAARVLIAGRPLQINLPKDILSGNEIELVLVAKEPKLKFLLQDNISKTGEALLSSKSGSATPITATSATLQNNISKTSEALLSSKSSSATPITATSATLQSNISKTSEALLSSKSSSATPVTATSTTLQSNISKTSEALLSSKSGSTTPITATSATLQSNISKTSEALLSSKSGSTTPITATSATLQSNISKTSETLLSSKSGSTTPITATPDLTQPDLDFTLGQKYQAVVDTRLANGNTRVLIAEHSLQMNLSKDILSGSKIELVFIAKEPNLKFLLQNNTSLDKSKGSAVISSTGSLIGSLAQGIAKSPASQPLISTTPILTSPPTNSAETSVLLQKTLSQSGLFYESHQSQWLVGEKTLIQLKQEPQGKLVIASGSTNISATVLNSDTPANTQNLPLVQQQLAVLETNHLAWHGEIWPKQIMEWEVLEKKSDGNKSEEDEQPTPWQTKLRLDLPKLGEVSATIMFNSGNVRIKIHTNTETTKLLKNNQPQLTTAMNIAGLNVQAVEVFHDDEK